MRQSGGIAAINAGVAEASHAAAFRTSAGFAVPARGNSARMFSSSAIRRAHTRKSRSPFFRPNTSITDWTNVRYRIDPELSLVSVSATRTLDNILTPGKRPWDHLSAYTAKVATSNSGYRAVHHSKLSVFSAVGEG